MRRQAFLILLCLFSLGVTELFASQKEPVIGWLSLPESLTVTGCEQLSTFDVRRQLARDRDVLFHSHPAVPVRLFCEVLQKRCSEGLWYAGFIEGEVTVSPPKYGSGNYLIEIKEGRRCKEAIVEVRGNSALSKEVIERTVLSNLQSAVSSEKASLETTSAQAFLHLDSGARRGLVHAVERTYGAQGHLFTDVFVSLEPEPATTRALVVIDVKDEGPRCVVATLKITGAKKNSEASVKRLLNVEQGTVVTNLFVKTLEERLFRSGRFLSHTVIPIRPEKGSNECVLNVVLKEYEEARVLDEEDSRGEKAFLAVRDWLATFHRSAQDLLFTASLPKSWTLSGAVSPKEGLVFGIHRTKDRPLEYRMLWTPSQVSLLRLGARERCSFELSKGQLELQLHVRPNPKAEDGNDFLMNAGFNFTSKKDEGNSPIAFDMVLAPVAFLSFPRTDGATVAVDGDLLTLSAQRGGATLDFKVNEKSGRLLSLTASKKDKSEKIVELSSTDGGFEVLKGVHERKSAECKQRVDEKDIIGSVSNFLTDIVFDDVVYGDSEKEKAKAELCRTKLVQPLVKEGSEFLSQMVSKPTTGIEFTLPMTNKPAGLFAMFGEPFRYIATAADTFPPYCWIRLAANGAFVILNGRPQNAGAYIQRLAMSRNVGPLAYLAIARMLAFVDGKVSINVAKRGLAEFEKTGLRKDVEFVVTVKPLRNFIGAVVQSMAKADEKSLKTFLEILPKADGDKAKKAMAYLKQEGTSADLLRTFLDDHVVPMVSPYLSNALQKIAKIKTKGK